MENFRKCMIKGNIEELYYFHKWIEKCFTKRHPENPSGDICYVETYALIECIKTGKVDYEEPTKIIFT
jgi:hypothetical protein